MNIDDFIEAIAKARIIQSIEEDMMSRAISNVFGEEG
jgi:hypothetical protein